MPHEFVVPERFDISHPNLCPALRWKGQFILAESDPNGADLQRWPVLVHAHPDLHRPRRQVAEPGNCAAKKPRLSRLGQVRVKY